MAKIDRITGRRAWVQRMINVFPKSLRLRFNPRRYEIETFVSKSARSLKPGSKVLDAGAGPCPYKPFFAKCNYEATDFVDSDKILDFTCSLDNIPKPAGTYDAIFCTEVLEHVENPQEVMDELHRVLRKSGKLYLTCPQGWMLHQEPYNYFYFTKYGLASVLKKSGFEKIRISPMGGYFEFLADALRFNSIAEQWKKIKIIYYPLALIDLIVFKMLFSFVLFHLDSLDRLKKWTMGYTVEATK